MAGEGSEPKPSTEDLEERLAEVERHAAEMERWKEDHEKRLREICEAMSEWCAEEHRSVEDLAMILRSMAAVIHLPGPAHQPHPLNLDRV